MSVAADIGQYYSRRKKGCQTKRELKERGKNLWVPVGDPSLKKLVFVRKLQSVLNNRSSNKVWPYRRYAY